MTQLEDNNKSYCVKMIGVNATYKCNLNCYMCGQRKNNDLDMTQEIDFNKLKKIILDAQKHDLRLGVYIWGGEPFLYSRIDELIEFLDSQKIFITINTNGVLLNKHLEVLLKCKNFVRLIISIDGSEDIHDKIRGKKGTYKRLTENIKNIVGLRKNRIIVSTNTVVTTLNYNKLSEIIDQIALLGIDYFECQLPIFITEEMGEKYENRMRKSFGIKATSWKGFQGNYYDIDIEILRKQVHDLKDKYGLKFKLNPDLSDNELEMYFKKPEQICSDKRCSLPFTQIHIEPNGNVVICPDFPDCIVGNIYESSLDEIWNSANNKIFREMITKENLPICSRCCQFYQF